MNTVIKLFGVVGLLVASNTTSAATLIPLGSFPFVGPSVFGIFGSIPIVGPLLGGTGQVSAFPLLGGLVGGGTLLGIPIGVFGALNSGSISNLAGLTNLAGTGK